MVVIDEDENIFDDDSDVSVVGVGVKKVQTGIWEQLPSLDDIKGTTNPRFAGTFCLKVNANKPRELIKVLTSKFIFIQYFLGEKLVKGLIQQINQKNKFTLQHELINESHVIFSNFPL